MKPDEKREVPKELVDELIEKLDTESDADWTKEYGAAGGKTTAPPMA